jgi:HJR/Mrr/RecB family endonuclease
MTYEKAEQNGKIAPCKSRCVLAACAMSRTIRSSTQSKVFAEYGSEVRVTQASRDGGVDAIAFDPDLIRGGKFVIQAKRYNKVVPVSAVRDLYQTLVAHPHLKRHAPSAVYDVSSFVLSSVLQK